ncbi:MAG: hypothetical protein IT379_42190 [Deltaproteobacteria bacterium]|nr:hypothetical protein [Deltaproteobacteria bacterium]
MNVSQLRKTALDLARRGVWTDEAVDVNRAILQADRTDALAWGRLARCHESLGGIGTAMACWEQAAAVACDDDRVTRQVATHHVAELRAKLPVRAAAAAVVAVESDREHDASPAAADFHDVLRTAGTTTGPARVHVARRLLGLADTPRRRSVALVVLGASLRKLGFRAQAEKAYRAALRYDASNPAAAVGLAATLADGGVLYESAQLCAEQLGRDPENAYARATLSRVACLRRARGDHDDHPFDVSGGDDSSATQPAPAPAEPVDATPVLSIAAELRRRPTSPNPRCSCGAIAMPGEDCCYSCSW